jgi:hypothetical protein
MKAKILLLVLVPLTFILFLSNISLAQEVVMGEKVIKSRGVNEYVLPAMDEFVERPVLSRGGCVVKVDNWTGYYVDLWVDKLYKGRLNPWASNQMILNQGWTEVYARTMGESYQWKSEGECNEEIILKLEAIENTQETESSDDF